MFAPVVATPSALSLAVPSDGAVESAAAGLAQRIRAHLRQATITVALTDNRYTMISVRRSKLPGRYGARAHYDVRMHSMFISAPPQLTRALAHYIAKGDRASSRALGQYIDAHVPAKAVRRVASVPVVTAGDVHDLAAIYNDLNSQYFGGAIEATITWGPRISRPKRRQSIKLGSYALEDRVIRIHRVLDRDTVPHYVVAWVVYHEMLHQKHDFRRRGSRREFHTPEFLRDEAKFAFFTQAKAWEKAHILQLLDG
ncbi:MAG: hypothetical protein IPL79_07980 [Myxococcales bacterium]|nr:hypothetical protein [Myxococcales bacterium]